MPKTPQRIKLMTEQADYVKNSEVVLLDGEVCLIDSGNGYNSLVVGDGNTKAKSLTLIPLNVSNGSVFLGAANPETIPGSPGEPVFYLASTEGTYTGFGNIRVESGEIAFLVYKYGGWNKVEILQTDSTLNETSTRPVQNRAVTAGLKDLERKITSGVITGPVDSEFSHQSGNPIMNRTVTNKFSEFDWYEE